MKIIKFEREPEISRWQVSFHEAAHAVLGEVFGLRVKSLRVLSGGDGTAKIATATHLSVPDQIALCMVGWVGAELGGYPHPSPDCHEITSDQLSAECLAMCVLDSEHTDADEFAIRTMLREGAQKARELISKHRTRFDEIAKALLREGELSSEDTKS